MVSPNSYCLAAPLDSTPVARSRVSCAPKLEWPSDPSRSLSVLNPRKSTLLSVILTSTRPSCLARAAGLRLGVDVAFVHQLLDQPAQQLVQLLLAHVFELLADLLGALLIEEIAALPALLRWRASDRRAYAG